MACQGLLEADQVGDTVVSVSSDSVVGSANVSVKPVLAVFYFSNAHTFGFADATVRLTDPDASSGSPCPSADAVPYHTAGNLKNNSQQK